jgi:hypothetical protein
VPEQLDIHVVEPHGRSEDSGGDQRDVPLDWVLQHVEASGYPPLLPHDLKRDQTDTVIGR